MTPELRAACVRSSHVVTRDGEILGGGRSTLFILRELGWRRLWVLRLPPMIWVLELGYWIFARNRPFFFRLLDRWISRLEPRGDEKPRTER